jgi:DNA-3-methyladenine glycosylase II
MNMNWDNEISTSIAHLADNDPLLANCIDVYLAPTFSPHHNYYQELVESIIGQQLSVKAAATITKRFVESFGHFPLPEELVSQDPELLRAVGLSYQKASYVQDLARRVLDGSVRFEHLDGLSNQEIIDELTAVKGIGEWTVHMFLIFCMGRLDVLATGDLGVKTAVKNLYGLSQLPTPSEMQEIAIKNNWQPYASLACWYLWKSLDNEPKKL